MKKMLSCLICVMFVFFLVSCGNNNSTAPISTLTPIPQYDLTGTWSGSASDSTGPSGTFVCCLTMTGVNISGTLSITTPGGILADGTISGVYGNGNYFDFTMNVPVGGIHSSLYASCSITLSGTANIYQMVSGPPWYEIDGTYTGNNSCSGPFTNGQMLLYKQ